MSKAEVKRHWDRVARMGCCICGMPYPTIHHVHGGSVKHLTQPGMGQKSSDWLVIPLDAKYHTGRYGIDGAMGVESWEKMFGAQLAFLDWVNARLPYDIYERAGLVLK